MIELVTNAFEPVLNALKNNDPCDNVERVANFVSDILSNDDDNGLCIGLSCGYHVAPRKSPQSSTRAKWTGKIRDYPG